VTGSSGNFTDWINVNGSSWGRRNTENVADIAAVAHVLAIGADNDNVIRRGHAPAGAHAQRDVVAASGVEIERIRTDGRVADAASVFNKCMTTVGSVGAAVGVV